MHLSQFHYLPLTPSFFSILVALFVGLLVILVVIGALRHAYLSLGVSPGAAMLLLLGSLIGSYFNIPIAALPPEQVESDKVIEFFGMEYTVPMVENLPGTVIAINVGGAVIPTIMSIYLLTSRRLWVSGAIATAIVAVVLHWLANPVPGVGIAVPIFVPALITAAVFAAAVAPGRGTACLYFRQHGHADRCRPNQPRQGGRTRRAGRFDRRRRYL